MFERNSHAEPKPNQSETVLRKERDLIRKILDLNTDGWWDLNLIGSKKEYFSPGFKKLFGYEAHELPNDFLTWEKLIHPEDRAKAIENFHQHISSGGRIPYYQKLRYLHKNGSVVWVICKGVAILGESGKFERMVGVHFNITKQMELEKSLKEANQKLIKKQEEMEQFVYFVSHDLKAPLVSSSSFISFLREDIENKNLTEAKDSLFEVEKALTKMKSLISDILEVSRAGHVPLNFECIDLKKLLETVFESLDNSQLNGEVEFLVDPELGTVRGDSNKIMRVFENLISNAIKYGDKEKIKIEIFSERTVDETRICIKDNGPGIEEKHLDKVFDIFQRFHSDREGTGVGLSVVKKIMEMHGGSVGAKSQWGSGAEFCLSFPERNRVSSGSANP